MEQALVFCHSGSTYAERPVALMWAGERLEIDVIEARWRSPGEIGFTVQTKDARRFTLVYFEVQETWQIKEI